MSFFHLKNTIERNKYLAEKNLKELNLHELSYIHLNTNSPAVKLQDCSVNSKLYGLHEILLMSSPVKDHHFVMLITVISLLNELCSLYTLKQTRSTNNFINFIMSFTSLTLDQAVLLYTLKESLQKDGSLANLQNVEGKILAVFKFNHHQREAITPPAVAWDGCYPIMSQEAYTLINVVELQKLAINIMDRIYQGLLKRKIEIVEMPAEDFFYKYLDKV
ncbi:hypothetical protein [Tatumella ptyseos]|uniref:hypothetical protein n=1 Tax=Tatumella ptyseos TaxID=82987 RepID=UPI0026F09CFB|nr:hypothetical protein [Tatumella ptyseos]WKX25445.1 hypothetical protein QJR74_08880 [Tatumella ptyseos]